MKIKLIISTIFIGCLISCAAEKQEVQGYEVSVIHVDNLELRDSLRSKMQSSLKRGRHKGRFLGQILGKSKTTVNVDSISSSSNNNK